MSIAVKFMCLALEAFLLSTMLSKACELISDKSDTAVQGGFLLLAVSGAIAIASAFFWFPSLGKIFK